MAAPTKQITPKEAQRILWQTGVLHWKLTPTQKEIYDFINGNDNKTVVIAASRRLGKTFCLAVIACEICLKQDNAIVKFIAPQTKMIKTILRPIMRDVLVDCPQDLRPEFKASEQLYRFPNGSEIQLAGTDNGNAENLRGGASNVCIVDEAGFCTDLDYIIKSILIPTTTHSRGKIVLASTPPKTSNHDFVEFMKAAIPKNGFIKKTIYDNPMLSKDQIQDIIDALGGEDTSEFRREYLAEFIQDEKSVVIPEFTPDLEKEIVKEWEKPPYYDAYASMDIGVKDLTVVLFAYYDFRNAKIIIDDEFVVGGKDMLTDHLAEQIKIREQTLFCHPVLKEPYKMYLRISDNNNLILLQDLQMKHNILFLPTAKDNADAAINNMRIHLKNKKIIINPRCKTLIYHLRYATWNKARTDYTRTPDGGHADGLDALSYLCRNINFSHNPYPSNFGLNYGDLFQTDSKVINETPTNKFFKEIFNWKKRL